MEDSAAHPASADAKPQTNGADPQWVAVAAIDALPDGGIRPIELAGFELLLVRNQDAFLAVQRLCPHDFADLAKGEVRDCRLYCARHSASFSLVDGSVGGGWLVRNLKIYPCRQDHGQVWVDVANIRLNPPTQRRRVAR